MTYVVTRTADFDNELYHYGVKGMKWGVRRDLGKKAKNAANLERYAKGYNAKAVRATRKADALERWGDLMGSKIQRDKASANIKLRDEMYGMRNKLMKDLSEKDIAQGRRYMAKSAIIGGLLAGPLGTAIATGADQARTLNYIENQRRKKI